MQIGEQKRV